nr:MAG TPA: hypothetical protein [Caudoviricetes sp.]
MNENQPEMILHNCYGIIQYRDCLCLHGLT